MRKNHVFSTRTATESLRTHLQKIHSELHGLSTQSRFDQSGTLKVFEMIKIDVVQRPLHLRITKWIVDTLLPFAGEKKTFVSLIKSINHI